MFGAEFIDCKLDGAGFSWCGFQQSGFIRSGLNQLTMEKCETEGMMRVGQQEQSMA